MKRHLITLCFLGLSAGLHGQNGIKPGAAGPARLSPGAALLFRNVKTSATDAEKNQLFQKLQLSLAADKKSFVMEGDAPVEPFVFPTDMNKDGQEELFVVLMSTALYGMTGESVVLYIKDKAGTFQQQAEVAGGPPMILTTKNLGYPDILIGGPGMEHAAYRWNGRSYAFYKHIKDAALNSKNFTDIEDYSKSFTGSK